MMSANRLGVARWLGTGLVLLAASGCASLAPGSGFAPVEQIAGELAGLLARPLSADDAVQIALLNNRGLQAAFFDLDIAQADLEGGCPIRSCRCCAPAA
ncbi:MAG: hypothetical protein NTV19_06960 [Burkholderiales bacterium]|nr:hypothetical protein [Burkholderiales bacterium]